MTNAAEVRDEPDDWCRSVAAVVGTSGLISVRDQVVIECIVQLMMGMRLATLAAAAAAAITVAAPAQADDYDAPFNAQLHTYGIYGPQDYTAWLARSPVSE